MKVRVITSMASAETGKTRVRGVSLGTTRKNSFLPGK